MNQTFACLHYVREIRNSLGGVVTAAIDLCQSMAARGHQVTLVTCDAADVPPSWSDASSGGNSPRVVEVSHAAFTKLLLSRDAKRQCAALIDAVDVAHLHTPWELGNYQLSPLLRRANVPYVVTVHGMLDHYSMRQKGLKKQAFLAIGGRQLFAHATTVHFTAESEKEQALHYIPGADRAFVQGCSLDFTPYNPLPGPETAYRAFPQLKPDVRKILFLSRVHPKKGVDLLIRAAAQLKGRSFPFQLLIAGPGDEPYVAELKRLAGELGVADDAHFLGMVGGVQKTSLYQAADVFVLPTHQENFGLVLPEAMACGTAVVTTRGTDIWRELQSGGASIVDGSPTSLADAIVEVTNDPQRCARLGQQGREFVHQWLDPNRVAAAYESMYFDAISRGAPPFSAAAPTPRGEFVAAR